MEYQMDLKLSRLYSY